MGSSPRRCRGTRPPSRQNLANFGFALQPSIDRSGIETLGTCQWIRENRTLLVQGPPRVGKTHLAVALGVKAVEHGFGVTFYRLEELLAGDEVLATACLPSPTRAIRYLNLEGNFG